jgi:hypothetical protein
MKKILKAVIDWLKFTPDMEPLFDPLFKLHDKTGAVVWEGKAANMLELVRFEEMHREVAQDYAELQLTLADEGDAKVDLLQRIDQLEAQNTTMGNAIFEVIKLDAPDNSFELKNVVAIAKAAVFS